MDDRAFFGRRTGNMVRIPKEATDYKKRHPNRLNEDGSITINDTTWKVGGKFDHLCLRRGNSSWGKCSGMPSSKTFVPIYRRKGLQRLTFQAHPTGKNAKRPACLQRSYNKKCPRDILTSLPIRKTAWLRSLYGSDSFGCVRANGNYSRRHTSSRHGIVITICIESRDNGA